MTKHGNQSWSKIFTLIFLTASLMACAESRSGSTALMQERRDESTHIVGGTKVQDSAPIAGKILYLAYGTQMQKTATNTRVTWQGRCTASALTTKIVLTAAHCVEGKTGLYVTSGSNPETTPLNLKQWYEVKDQKVHPQYVGSPQAIVNDVALLLLDRELPASRVMMLATADQVQIPMDFMSVGYGIASESSDPQVQGESYDGLRSVMKKLTELRLQSNVFSLDQTDHKGFCSGDSGGPGVIQDPKTKEFLILGVVSNVSMNQQEEAAFDPNGIYSLCIGHGNYTNTLNPGIRAWIEKTKEELVEKS